MPNPTPFTPAQTVITTASPIVWSDNVTLFDGFILIGVALPSQSGTQFPALHYLGNFPALRLPLWTMVPVKQGVPDQNTFIFYTTQIDPPNCQYVAYWLDTTKTIISGPSVLFTVTGTPFNITVPVLTLPVAAVVGPTPATVSQYDV